MSVFLDIETTELIEIPENGCIANWIKRKNEGKFTKDGNLKKNSKLFNPYVDTDFAIPSLMGVQYYDDAEKGLSNVKILSSKNGIINEFAEILKTREYIITFNGNRFDLPILARLLVREGKVGLSEYGQIVNLFRGKYEYSIDLAKLLAPTMDRMKPLKVFAESFGIKVDKDIDEIWNDIEEGIQLPDLKKKVEDDIRITRELYFKFDSPTH